MTQDKGRLESDALGPVEIPPGALWGVHTERARKNFAFTQRRVPYALIAAIATVKRAAAEANKELGALPPDIADAILAGCDRVIEGGVAMEAQFPLDALQGGAGTSTNMNLNEVIANLALVRLGQQPGDYVRVHPLLHVNLHQSTNDVYPTGLRIAAIGEVRALSEALARLQGTFQAKETAFQSIVKMGRTEMQQAVPMTLGQEFSAFAEAIARDRWRTFKCEERLRLVNLGGTAIGTGLTAPRRYIFRVIEILRALTGMGLSRGENVIDATANADAFVEVAGILDASAANLSKIAGDLRLLHFLGEIRLPALQAGSSIMPGKVNPVMAEAAIEAAILVQANTRIVSDCAARGTLQINEFLPLLAMALLESLSVLKAVAEALAAHVDGIEADAARAAALADSPTLVTALLPQIGYERAEALLKDYAAARAADTHLTLRDFLVAQLGAESVETALSPQNLLKLGHD